MGLNPLELKYRMDVEILAILEIIGGEGNREEISHLCRKINRNYIDYFNLEFESCLRFLLNKGFVVINNPAKYYKIGKYERPEEWKEKVREIYNKLKAVI